MGFALLRSDFLCELSRMPSEGLVLLLQLIRSQDQGLNLPIQVLVYLVGRLELYCQLLNPVSHRSRWVGIKGMHI